MSIASREGIGSARVPKRASVPSERFVLTLEALPTDDRPAAIRLRALLKFSLRAFGLKCVTVRESTNDKPTTDEKDGDDGKTLEVD